jgi:hypothetical protein
MEIYFEKYPTFLLNALYKYNKLGEKAENHT